MNQIDGQFSARLIAMLESPAWRVLSQSAHRALDRICIELAHHGGNDNGRLPVTYEQFAEYGIDRHAISPAIRELAALGFVEITQRGKPSAGSFRWPNYFRLTCINCKSSPNPTHEWRRIRTMEDAAVIARSARRGKQKPGVEFPHCDSVEIPHCEKHSPVLVSPTTSPVVGSPTTSISRGQTPTEQGSRSALPHSAVASEPCGLQAGFDPRRYSGPEGEVSRRRKCDHCHRRGETRKIWHGQFAAAWLHGDCIPLWKADYDERNTDSEAAA